MAGATIFPHNIGIGATRDPALAQPRVGSRPPRPAPPVRSGASRPACAWPATIRWGRTYESFGEDPALVSRMESEIDGTPGRRPGGPHQRRFVAGATDHILATAKHFAGDGGDQLRHRRQRLSDRPGRDDHRFRDVPEAVRLSVRDRRPTAPGRLDHALVLERGARRGGVPDQDERRQAAADRRPQAADRLRRLPDQRLQRRRPDRRLALVPDPLAAARRGARHVQLPDRRVGQRRHGHVHGPQQLPDARERSDHARQQWRRADVTRRRRRAPGAHPEVRARPVRASVHRPQQHRPGRRRRPPGRGRPRRGGVSGAAQERPARAPAVRARRGSTWPAATPTTSAPRPAAGRSPGRASRGADRRHRDDDPAGDPGQGRRT